MSKITTTILKLAINNNDYNKIEHLLIHNPDFIIEYEVLDKALEKRFPKCFDLIIDRINIDDSLTSIYDTAFDIYMKAKNEENKYFIDKLLEKKLYIPLSNTFIQNLLKFDINKFNNYIEIIINTNDKIKINNLLSYLLPNESFMYFLDIFNSKLTLEEQKLFIRDDLYLSYHRCYDDYTQAFNHFLNDKDFDYNTSISDVVGDKLNNHLIFKMMSGDIKIPSAYSNYLLENLCDFKNMPIEYINDMLCKLVKNNKNNLNNIIKKKIINKPLISNCPKINLLKDIIFRIYLENYNMNNFLLLCYIMYEIGFNFDIYNEIDSIGSIINAYNIRARYKYKVYEMSYIEIKQVLIDTVRFGRYIGQDIPEHLRDSIYKFYENNELLDTPVTYEEIQKLIKKVK